KRVSLVALTVDPHHPDGFSARTCERKREEVAGPQNLSGSAGRCSRAPSVAPMTASRQACCGCGAGAG
ncbi:hypothetical protein, partial [Klebsiella pneumoniae]|uniref:hypothetical protein n=1 Tax=Klebsiella pneumoniae TaxID=573 RepID=UPI0039C019AE